MAWMALKMLGCLALLMFGMKSMSEALQKMAGPQLRHVLGTMTTNRFTGMLTGMFVTASVQSSTATTLMTVSFVNAGLLTLMQAISIILIPCGLEQHIVEIAGVDIDWRYIVVVSAHAVTTDLVNIEELRGSRCTFENDCYGTE